ncbi:MAG: Uma2 family endonuclease [Fulvimarina manganoxydans]|uniref:Uma2 family endonuclease n=1 Tax=Fulvimarina manganoxydans TaxID=937218 RepID=UPI0023556DD7|nr:Uma2 family endonuclease [Fulvimarina manganoxydans]MCK5931222.1 Uma2 family endonuclease [Fulvimarina manganoxydans]
MSALADDRKIDEAAQTLTVEAFFDWIEHREERFELVEGVVRMLPNVRRNHSTIVGNLDHALQTRIDRTALRVRQGDFAIQTGPSSIRYADILIEPAGGEGRGRRTDHAIFIAEVLSESTTHLDFGEKRLEYFDLPSLRTYLIIAQDRPVVWHWTRSAEGSWPEEPRIIEEGPIQIVEPEIAFDLSELYLDVS